METKFIYDLMLPYFVGDDDLRPVMKKVHKCNNGYLYASDGHIAIRVQQDKVCREYDEVPGFPNADLVIQNAIDREGNTKAVIETSNLIRLLAYVNWYRVKDGDRCKNCGGDGVYTCKYCDSECECECVECRGTGIVSERIKEFALLQSEDHYTIKIGKLTYKAEYLYIIALFAQMLQLDEITYLYESDRESSIFSFPGVDILLMTYMTNRANVVMKLK
jgi:hypothetical protein